MNIDIRNMDFSVRTENVLKHNDITNMNQLTELSTRTILQWRNCGKKAIMEIRAKLAENGLCLKDEFVNEDIKKTLIYDLPEVLNNMKIQVEELQSDLRFLCYKIEQTSINCTRAKKGYELQLEKNNELAKKSME